MGIRNRRQGIGDLAEDRVSVASTVGKIPIDVCPNVRNIKGVTTTSPS